MIHLSFIVYDEITITQTYLIVLRKVESDKLLAVQNNMLKNKIISC